MPVLTGLNGGCCPVLLTDHYQRSLQPSSLQVIAPATTVRLEAEKPIPQRNVNAKNRVPGFSYSALTIRP
jgi:hypothetical protein